jgi:hypothetical protein
MIKRRRFKQEISLKERLAKDAQDCRERAVELPVGREREVLLRRARQADTAARINEWISSPGLQPPE